ncbi:MAG: tyrosine-type recombinase/integrase [Clostridium sp.]|nr:tyrosine-type recombinase/integrase [Clostridium sp.]
MSDKRRDNKGRILRTGESQRTNGMYEFRLDIIPNNTQKRVALTPKQQEQFLEYIKHDAHFCRYLDEIKILLGTGMRISEFCGLTISDLDFDRRRIRVDHQLVRTRDGKRYIEKTKTECGCRYIPMSDEVYESFYNILLSRKKQKKEA